MEVFGNISTETMARHEWVKYEDHLAEVELLKKRCLHDIVNLLLNSIKDTQPTDDPRDVLRSLAAAVYETGTADFGTGECSCNRPACPYKVKASQPLFNQTGSQI